MPRYQDIKERIDDEIEYLIQLYHDTDPRKGEESEFRKFELAQEAIVVWWRVYAELITWAQSQIIGYEMTRLNGPLIEFLQESRGSDVDENSHELEVLGNLYRANLPPDEYPQLPELLDFIEENDPQFIDLDDQILRRVIVRLLLSTSTESSVWRFPLSEALRAVNAGELPSFLTPSRQRRRGRPYILDMLRAEAIAHVWFEEGRGLKKHAALTRVATALAVSEETLRDWEKQIKDDDLIYFEWQAAWLAGFIQENPDTDPEEEFEPRYLGNRSQLFYARHFIKRKRSLDTIRDELRKHHS